MFLKLACGSSVLLAESIFTTGVVIRRVKHLNVGLKAAAAFLLLNLITSCNNLPRDPNRTLSQLQSRPLRVGVVENYPWVIKTDDEPAGIEVNLVHDFATRQGATVEWIWGSEQQQLEALEHYQLDMVIGGFTDDSPWRKYVGFTSPYFEERYVVGTRG